MTALSILAMLVPGAMGIGALLVALGLIGRRRGDEPRCSRCNADVRGAVWSEPLRCACGASLESFGSVRTGRWRRSWRSVIVGAIFLGLGLGAIGIATKSSRDREWLSRWAPWWLVDWRLGAGDRWAQTETVRRLEQDELSPSQASGLALVIGRARSAVARNSAGGFDSSADLWALRRADRTDQRLHDAAADALADSIVSGSAAARATRGERLSLVLLPSAGLSTNEAFLLLDEVRVNGQPARWRRLHDDPGDDPIGDPLGEQGEARGDNPALREPLLVGAAISIELPDLPIGTHTVSLDGLFGRVVFLDPRLIASVASDPARRSDPATWGVPAFGARRTIDLPFVLAPSDAEEEVPDAR